MNLLSEGHLKISGTLNCRLLGDKSPFSQLNLQRDTMDRDEETARIQYLAEIAMFLGITSTLDTEVIQGQGSYEDRTEKLRLIVDHVEVSRYANNLEWSVDEQVAKDIQLIDSIAEKQALIFSEECKLFPADKVNDLASKHAYNPDEEYAEVESDSRHIWNLFWKLQGNTPLDAHDGSATTSWVWTRCQPVVGGIQDALEDNLLMVSNHDLKLFAAIYWQSKLRDHCLINEVVSAASIDEHCYSCSSNFPTHVRFGGIRHQQWHETRFLVCLHNSSFLKNH
uniref:Uncharacterized protein n=1 Tax=Populus alba TaxID=43335 RepID=A0A4U5PX72_POPAL|nr:hypothetical protein D5086_0000170160 [Populus alba]